MVGLSFCDFVGTREEKVKMAEYRKKEWPRRYKVAIILFIKSTRTLRTFYWSFLITLYLLKNAEWFPSVAISSTEA